MLFFNGRQSYSTSDDGTAVDSCWLNLVLLQLAGRFYDAQLVSMKVKLMQFLPYYLEYILCTVYTALQYSKNESEAKK